jgi:hypothetical protein
MIRNAEIASTNFLRDISSNGSSSDYIGTEPASILNDGKPCIVDGVRNIKDSEGCSFLN